MTHRNAQPMRSPMSRKSSAPATHAATPTPFTAHDVRACLAAHPALSREGYGRPRLWSGSPPAEISPDRYGTILLVAEWLTEICVPTRGLDTSRSSYHWKHLAESALGDRVDFYVSNGEFICAALVAGFRMERGEFNPYFAMRRRAAVSRVAA